MNLVNQLDSTTSKWTQLNVNRLKSLTEELSQKYDTLFLRIFTSHICDFFSWRHFYYDSSSSRHFLYQNSVFDAFKNSKLKRASTLTLQDVSENQISLTRTQSQQKFSSLSISVLKDCSKFHKWQSSVHICTLTTIIIESVIFSSTVNKSKDSSETSMHESQISDLTFRKSHFLFQSLFFMIFNSQLSSSFNYTSIYQALSLSLKETHYSAHSIQSLYLIFFIFLVKCSHTFSKESLFNLKVFLMSNKCSKHLFSIFFTWFTHSIFTLIMHSFSNSSLIITHSSTSLFQLFVLFTSTSLSCNHNHTNSHTLSIIYDSCFQPLWLLIRLSTMKHTLNYSFFDDHDLHWNVLTLKCISSEIDDLTLSVIDVKRHLRMRLLSWLRKKRYSELSLKIEMKSEERSLLWKIWKNSDDIRDFLVCDEK